MEVLQQPKKKQSAVEMCIEKVSRRSSELFAFLWVQNENKSRLIWFDVIAQSD